jgi:TatD DNase family protein
MPALIDSHCHLDFAAFDADREAVLERARTAGVTHIVIPGVDRDNWPRVRALCADNPALAACYGLHPYRADRHQPGDLDDLREFLATPACVALGECGLDYRDGMPDRDIQQFYFDAQLDIASELGMPVVVHAVRATEAVITALRARSGLRGMVHSYSGSAEQARQLLDLGFLLSFGGAITHDRARRLRELVAKLPLSALLLETDAPDQPPASRRDERNEPAAIAEVLATVAALNGHSATEIAAATTANARTLFGLAA